MRKLAFLFQTLSDANRLSLLKTIGTRSLSVSQLVEATGMSQPLVSHHLKVLREREILKTDRKGPFVYYSLKDSRLLDILGIFSEIAVSATRIEPNQRAFRCPDWFRKR